MISNADIKWVRSLREKKFRDREGVFVVEGEKMVREARESGFDIVKEWFRDDIGESAMARISGLSSPSPALAVVKRRPVSDADSSPVPGLCLALDAVRDPGNLGTILRIADWFGIAAVYASADSADVYNPKVVQATMGAVFRIKTVYCDVPALCRGFRSAGREVFGTFLDGGNIYSEPCLPDDALIVMGNEAAGISDAVSREVSRRILIPRYGVSGAESLNVAVATAITVAEFRRKS